MNSSLARGLTQRRATSAASRRHIVKNVRNVLPYSSKVLRASASQASVEAIATKIADNHHAEDSHENEFKQAPEWVKLVAIAVTSAFVALFELAICKRAPFFWAPGFFLLSFILWRFSLRETSNSNVPARSPDRLFMVAVTCLIMLWEYTIKRVVVYAPWLCIVVAILLSPSRKEMDYRERYLAEETMIRAEREYLNRVPVTPKESAAWFGRLLTCFWGPFFEPMLLRTAIVPLQEQVESAAPQGWSLTLDSFSLGDVAPTLTGWQVFNNVHTGEVEKVTADFNLDTSSLTMGLTGTGPFVGVFSVSLKGISLRGTVQFMPFSRSRLMLFSFLQQPELSVKLNVRGRFIGQQAVPQFAFLRAAIVSAIEKDFVEPNRGLVPLDYAPIVGDPLTTRIIVHIKAVIGLSISDQSLLVEDSDVRSMQNLEERDGVSIEINPLRSFDNKAREMSNSIMSKVAENVPAARAGAVRVHLKVPEMQLERTSRSTTIHSDGQAQIDESFSFQLSAQQGTVELRVANERGFTIGTAKLRIAHLPDGSTGMWASEPGGKPVATRWNVGVSPWKASIELQGSNHAYMDIECRTEGWQYSLDLSTPRQFRKGLRSVVAVQVLEARDIVPKDFNGSSDPYIIFSYNKRAASTRTAFKTLNPVFGDVLLFQENRSMLARRMRLDVLDRDKNSIRGDDSCGWAQANLDLVAEGQVTDQWLQLRGVQSGEVRIRMLVLSGTDDSTEVREEAVRSLEASEVVYTSDVLKCSILRAEGLKLGARQKPCIVEVVYGRTSQCTSKRKPDIESGGAQWNEDLRFRVNEGLDQGAVTKIRINVRDGSGAGVGNSGKEIGHAILQTSIISTELDSMRSKQMPSDITPLGEELARRGLPIASFNRSKEIQPEAAKPANWKAQQVKVAAKQGQGVIVRRTQVVEVWVPLQNAGSDARILVHLQGALGDNRELARNPFGDASRFTQKTIDNVKSADGPMNDIVGRVQQFGKDIASQLFD